MGGSLKGATVIHPRSFSLTACGFAPMSVCFVYKGRVLLKGGHELLRTGAQATLHEYHAGTPGSRYTISFLIGVGFSPFFWHVCFNDQTVLGFQVTQAQVEEDIISAFAGGHGTISLRFRDCIATESPGCSHYGLVPILCVAPQFFRAGSSQKIPQANMALNTWYRSIYS